jgi:hypothetical protein
MKRRRVDSKLERQFLIALATSKSFLASALPEIDFDLLQSEYARQIARWCVEYFRKYGKAPGPNLEPIYHAWVEEDTRDETTTDAIGDLLGSLSEESDNTKQLNVPYLLDQFGTYLSMRRLARMNENLSAHLLRADKEAALREVSDFRSVDLGQGCGFNPLEDRAAWGRAFANPADPLLCFPGDAGKFLNRVLTRDALIAVQAVEKKGKTFWCLEFVMRALRNHCRVALFEVGDMSESQIMRRMGVRLAGLPMYKDQLGEISVPRKIERVDRDDGDELPVEMTYETKSCDQVISRRASLRASYKFARACGIQRGIPHVLFSIHPNSSINVNGIDGILQRWEHEKQFVPDVVVIDYADILAPEDPRREFRHQVNDTWKALRRLSQERHCLVIAPTQANASSYDADVQTMKHVSEDKRKWSHVTGALGLNQTQAEKDMGLMRLNWVVLREAEFMTHRCLYVGQCLALGRAFCCGTM